MSFMSVEDTIPLFFTYGVPDLDLAEFGIYSGNTLKRLIDQTEAIGKPFRKVWAMDAFVGGLPKETEGIWRNPDWNEHAFDISADKGLNSVEEAIAFVHNHVQRDNVNYVAGYFSESLNEDLAQKIGRNNLSYVHVDCDVHSSSLEVLKFIFKYKLPCKGALIRFDDWASVPAFAGQKLAWSQISNKYQVTYSILADNVFWIVNYE